MNYYITSDDIRDMVLASLHEGGVASWVADFDVDGIVADIIKVSEYGPRGYGVEFEAEDFWEIVARHAI